VNPVLQHVRMIQSRAWLPPIHTDGVKGHTIHTCSRKGTPNVPSSVYRISLSTSEVYRMATNSRSEPKINTIRLALLGKLGDEAEDSDDLTTRHRKTGNTPPTCHIGRIFAEWCSDHLSLPNDGPLLDKIFQSDRQNKMSLAREQKCYSGVYVAQKRSRV